ncbi:hypothetical protein GCG54_00000391 [Colletotrichum gloeosporioides]|uniref:Uncharacterized protein n=1 Tax=Colletotrichum gloeosporioides TaxID=474922 RepID=A0A8H4CUZ8_COLGL|nr:uncharacterized protein GCG54_00000391 [Colletotrichum gloeosporioides]KAF3810346.1 hypothetical protein GCG54_00000391 [Colletotrichum gloeosporioides]
MPKQQSGRGTDRDGLYQCSQCSRRYHRSEHLVRHVRSHTKQRPYACNMCGKAFGRLDILRRHQFAHPGEDDVLADNSQRAGTERVGKACKLCSSTKSKCSEEKPCHRCLAKGLVCEYEPAHQEREEPGDLQRRQRGENAASDVELAKSAPEAEQSVSMHVVHARDYMTQIHPRLVTRSIQMIYSQHPITPQACYQRHADYFSFGPDWDIGTLDFSFIQAQFELGDANTTPGDVSDSCQDTLIPLVSGSKNVALSDIWEPKNHEHNEMERQNLAVGEGAFGVSHSKKATGNRVPELCVSPAIRSKVVGMILRTTSESRSAEVLGCFPGCQALSSLLDIYSDYWEATQIYDFVHLPTLDLCKQAPELLGALIAIGAIQAESIVARKFGYAMQEVVRASAFDSWEGNNAAVCDISLAQGFLLQQQIAFFSGVRRKVALAEACSKAAEVLIMNGGHMKGARQTDCQDLSTITEAHGDTLDGLWRQWSLRESQRRLVYASYILDAHVSMSHGTQMISTYVDMDMPLPAPSRLWKASSAMQWKDEIVALHVAQVSEPRSSICLTKLMAQPLSSPAGFKDMDSDVAIFAFLAGVWALCMECHQLSFVLGQSSTWSHMILGSRRNELCCTMKAFVSQLQLTEVPITAEMEVLFEALIMHTLTQRDTPILRHLAFSRPESDPMCQGPSPSPSRSTEYCHALWRAGRVIRAARNCPSGKLCGVFASSLFQAVLLLWRHGQSCQSLDGSALPTCIIDEDGCQEHHVLVGNIGLAVYGVRSVPVLIKSEAFGESIREVIKMNWEGKYMPSCAAGICDSLSNLSRENKDH